MSKYFIEEGKELEKHKLSDYLEIDAEDYKRFQCLEKYRKQRTRHIMGIIGDVEFDEKTYDLFLRQFDCFGGKYNVLSKKETIKGIYDISQKYPYLSPAALDEIWFEYINDLFEEYSLKDALEQFIEKYGKTEKALFSYLHYIEEIAEEYNKKFHIEAAKLSVFCEGYGPELIKHLQYLIKSQHVTADKVMDSLPSLKLIYKDNMQLGEIMSQTRIFLGACNPISYQMIDCLATEDNLDRFPEQPKYCINGGKTIDATFTKQEFLDSIKEKYVTKDDSKVLKYQK